MGVPTVTATSPSHNATDVDSRATLSVTFSEAVDTDTANEGTIVLSDDETLETIEGKITFSSSDKKVSFLPNRELRSNKLYTFIIAGTDLSAPAGEIQSASTNGKLATTSRISFRVKTERFVSLAEVTDRDDIDHVAPVREESELSLTTNTISIESSTPESFSSNNSQVNQIVITVSENVDVDLFDADTMFSIEMNPILDINMFYGNFNEDDDRKLRYQDDTLPISVPAGSVEASSNTITWYRNIVSPSGDEHPYLNTFPFNAEVIVTIDSSLTGISGNTLGEDVKVTFTTELFPMFSGSRTTRLDIGASLDNVYDDTINRLVLKRSIEAWMMSGERFDLEEPILMAIDFTRWATVLDALEVLSVKADILAGVSKDLGDFRVSYSNRVFTKGTGRFATAKEKMEAAEYKLRVSHPTLRVKVPVIGSTAQNSGQVLFRGVRNWDTVLRSISNRPTANSPRDRQIMKIVDQGGRGTAKTSAFLASGTFDDPYIYLYLP